MSLHRQNIIAETVSAAILQEAVSYDAATGKFVWRERPVAHFPDGKPTPERRAAMWNGKYAGKPAFTSNDPRGYLRGAVRGMNVYAHRAAFACVHGRWPDGEIDHINRDKSDNRIENLREVSHRQNRLNAADCDRASKGIRRNRKGDKWWLQIKIYGRAQHVGTFICLGDAFKARQLCGGRSL